MNCFLNNLRRKSPSSYILFLHVRKLLKEKNGIKPLTIFLLGVITDVYKADKKNERLKKKIIKIAAKIYLDTNSVNNEKK